VTTPRDTPLTRFLTTQTPQQLRDIRAEFRAEIDAGRQRLTELEEDLAVVEDAIAAKSGTPRRSLNGGPPRAPLMKTVLEFVGERPTGWTKQEILEELGRRGAAPKGKNPGNTLVTRLGEMVKRGQLEKFGELYRLGDGIAEPKGGSAQGSLPVGPEREK
jgi:hypothetical protein